MKWKERGRGYELEGGGEDDIKWKDEGGGSEVEGGGGYEVEGGGENVEGGGGYEVERDGGMKRKKKWKRTKIGTRKWGENEAK